MNELPVESGAAEKTMYQLRQFRFPEDYPAVTALWSRSGPGVQVRRSDEPEEIAKKVQRDGDLFLVAEIQGEIVGTVVGGFDGRRGMIYHLAVATEWKHQGIGDALMQEVEQRLRAKGCIRCYLLVTRENENAMRFYEKRGWELMDWVVPYGKEL